jgi:glycosyltransferase involved in cell wall biosynthesis
MAPEVTVVIPAYNAQNTITQALSSALTQGGTQAEVIVVDDGSVDGTRRVVTEAANAAGPARIRLLSHEGGVNRGVGASRNLGLEAARGALIAFLDADDLLLPGALAAGLEVFRAFPEVVLVYGRVQRSGVTGGRAPFVGLGVPNKPVSLARWLLFENPLPTSGTMVRRRPMLQCRFPEGLRHQIEDWAAWLALSRQGQAYFLDRELACYRRSAGSWTERLADRWVRHAQLIEEADLLRSLLRREPEVPVTDVNEALAYRSGVLLVETAGQLFRLRLGTARRCFTSARAIAGSAKILARATCWVPRIRLRSWFPARRTAGPAWRAFTAS